MTTDGIGGKLLDHENGSDQEGCRRVMRRSTATTAVALLAAVVTAAACTPTEGQTIRHVPGQWPLVVVEDHTPAGYPVNGAFGPVWGIGGAIRGNCASFPDRVCYRLVVGNSGNNGGYTRYTYVGTSIISCTTTFSPLVGGYPPATRQEIVEHEIGHCYGLAHAAQGTGTMEPVVAGRFPVPTGDERATLRSLYLG